MTKPFSELRAAMSPQAQERAREIASEHARWLDAPERIYLQVCSEDQCESAFHDHTDISWCEDKVNERDVEYVRADVADARQAEDPLRHQAEIAHLRETLERTATALERVLGSKPVRDADEVLVCARAALAAGKEERS